MLPYNLESHVSKVGLELPHGVQEEGREIRTFMPKWGEINERRNQLHEVIRLSGMNIIVDDTDHQLIIKVASVQSARMQVYFIDTDDYFLKRGMKNDDKGKEYADNVERAAFFARGVLETVRKLRWTPDIVHCSGWIAAAAPLYIKTVYKDTPTFADSKVVFSAFKETLEGPQPKNFKESLLFKGVTMKMLDETGIDFTSPDALTQLAVMFSDGYLQTEKGAQPKTTDYAKKMGIPTLTFPGSTKLSLKVTDFYEQIVGDKEE